MTTSKEQKHPFRLFDRKVDELQNSEQVGETIKMSTLNRKVWRNKTTQEYYETYEQADNEDI